VISFGKGPNDSLDYQIDWTGWLGVGETITTSTWTVPTGLTAGLAVNSQTTATQWLSGGTIGQLYTVINRIVTSAGRTEERGFELVIIGR
jgi:hypothetical protein